MRRLSPGSALVLLCVFLLAGCGGGPTGGDTIRLGMITSLTGANSSLGVFNKRAVDLLAKQLNDAGGIGGRPVAVEIEDDQSNPSNGAPELKKLIGNGVVALIGPVSSSTCVAIIDEVEAAKLPTITTCATDAQVNPIRPYVFMAPPASGSVVNPLLAYLKSEGKTRIAVLHDTTEYGTTGWAVIKAAAPGYGIAVDEQGYEAASTTFVPQLTKIRNSDAQAVLSWGAGTPAVTITREFRQLGLMVPLCFSHAQATPLYTEPAGDAANGVILGTSLGPVGRYLPDANPSKPLIMRYDADFDAAYHTSPAGFAYNTYSAFTMLVNAIRTVGTDPQKMRAQLEQTTFVSVGGTYRYSPTNHAGLGPDSVRVAQIRNGVLVPLTFGGELSPPFP